MTLIPWQDHYIKAYRFAAHAHHGQTVPDTDIPYLMHLSLVSMEVIASFAAESGRDAALAVQCALLHDVIEDTGATYEQVLAVFGLPVADGVLALTKDVTLATKPEQMADSLRRIREQPYEIWLVKLSDRITNLQPPPSYWTPDKRRSYQAEAVAILAALGGASRYLAGRLKSKIAGEFWGHHTYLYIIKYSVPEICCLRYRDGSGVKFEHLAPEKAEELKPMLERRKKLQEDLKSNKKRVLTLDAILPKG